jgi:cytochrome c6
MKGSLSFIRFLIFALLMLTVGSAMAGDPVKGRGIYMDRCSGCHGQNGKPDIAEVPNFSVGEGMMKPDNELMATIKQGKAVMPGFEGVLTDDQIFDVISYIRTLF